MDLNGNGTLPTGVGAALGPPLRLAEPAAAWRSERPSANMATEEGSAEGYQISERPRF